MLRDEIYKMKESSPGLDGWSHIDLKLLSHAAPWVIDSLCQLLSAVEQTGAWPSSIISGFTTLIPKSSETPETPTDLRPITVLSVLYRVWARIRACQLNVLWQELFAHKGMWGGRTSRGAEPLLLDVALDLEVTSAAHVAGLSFDLSKAFDRVPRELLGKILAKMSMPGCVFRPYMHMLRNATRRYKLGASLDASQPLSGGILQGCPLAMLSMNAICNIWLRSLEATVSCFPRSYVDDVSVTVMEDSPEALINACRDVYSCSTKFVNATGGKINAKKCFTFGSTAVKVPPLLKVPFLTTSLILMNFGSLAGPLFPGQMILCPPPPWSYNV